MIENQIMKVEMKRSRTIQRKDTTMARMKPDRRTHQPVRMSMNTPSATCEGGTDGVGGGLWCARLLYVRSELIFVIISLHINANLLIYLY